MGKLKNKNKITASGAAHDVRACARARRVRPRILYTPPTASGPSRHGILRDGPRDGPLGMRKGGDGAIPGTCVSLGRHFGYFLSLPIPLSLSLIFFSFDRRGVAHVFGRPGRGGGAVDCTWMEAHASEAFEEGYVEDLLGTHVVIFVVTFRCAPFFKPVAPKPVLMLLPGGL